MDKEVVMDIPGRGRDVRIATTKMGHRDKWWPRCSPALSRVGDLEWLTKLRASVLVWDPLHESSGKCALRIGAGCKAQKRSNSRSYCEYLQRCRPPETADANGAMICAEDP